MQNRPSHSDSTLISFTETRGFGLSLDFFADPRVRKLSVHEVKDLIRFCSLACRCRENPEIYDTSGAFLEPGVIPPMEPRILAKRLGLSRKMTEKRLSAWAAPNVAMIAVREDGSLVIAPVEEEVPDAARL